jgi:hypothetical protein
LDEQRLLLNATRLDDPSADQVLLDNPLEDRRITRPVPGAFRIHNGDWTALAHSQAVGLRAKHSALLGQPQFAEASLEIVPGGLSALLVAALWF